MGIESLGGRPFIKLHGFFFSFDSYSLFFNPRLSSESSNNSSSSDKDSS